MRVFGESSMSMKDRVESFIERSGIEDDRGRGEEREDTGCTCISTPSSRCRDRRLEYRLTLVFVRNSTSPFDPPESSPATTFGILRSFVRQLRASSTTFRYLLSSSFPRVSLVHLSTLYLFTYVHR